MWIVWIVTALAAVSGFYSISTQRIETNLAAAKSEDLAANMAVYRNAVIEYLAANPGITGPAAVPDAALATVYPAWYRPWPNWANYLSADGMITIYAAAVPEQRITSQIEAESHHSILAGEANAALGGGYLYSTRFGRTNIPLPDTITIPNGSPVWMANRIVR